jgi:exonuclease 3'-5' domain-containing protein 1
MTTPPATIKTDDEPGLIGITRLLDQVGIDNGISADIIDTVAALSDLLNAVEGLPTQPPSLYIDLEGEHLSRDGTISILQLYLLPTKRTYLIDIFTLGSKRFTTCGRSSRTLQEILQDPETPKVFFDVRNDSDALYSHYNIRLAGIQDLQLMEVATRPFGRRCVNGLAKCIEKEGGLSLHESQEWKQCKDKGLRLFAPEHGGSYKVFNERPLSKEILHYCAQDVHFLPRLWEHYNRKLTPTWRQRVTKATKARVVESQSNSYVAHGKHKALAPPDWLRLR